MGGNNITALMLRATCSEYRPIYFFPVFQLATLNSVSALASFTHAIAAPGDSGPDLPQPEDGATSGSGPTMTYRKRGVKRLMLKSGDSTSFEKGGGVHLVSVSMRSIDTDVNSNSRVLDGGTDSQSKCNHDIISKERTADHEEQLEKDTIENDVENVL